MIEPLTGEDLKTLLGDKEMLIYQLSLYIKKLETELAKCAADVVEDEAQGSVA